MAEVTKQIRGLVNGMRRRIRAVQNNGGDGGQKRLWLTKTEFIDIGKETFMEAVASESSDRIKNPGSDVIDAMRLHAHQLQGHNVGHEFFQGKSTLHAQENQKKSESEKTKGADETITDSPAKLKAIKKRKKSPDEVVDLEASEDEGQVEESPAKKARTASAASFVSFRTTWYTKISTDFTKKEASLTEVLPSALKSLNAGREKEAVENLSNNTDKTTRALYMKTLGIRLTIAYAWFGKEIPATVLEEAGLQDQDLLEEVGHRRTKKVPATPPTEQPAIEKPPTADTEATPGIEAAAAALTAVAAVEAAEPAEPAVRDAVGVQDAAEVKSEDVGPPDSVLNPDGYLTYYIDKFSADELGIAIPKHARSQHFAQTFVDSVPVTSETVQLTKKKLVWTRLWKALSDLETSVKKSSADVSKHIVLMKAAKSKAELKARELADKEALAKQKEVLRIRSEKVQCGQQSQLDPISQVPNNLFKAMPSYEGELPGNVDLDSPFILSKSKAISDWIDDKVQQQVMDAYGKSYKKKSGFEEEQKQSQPLQGKQGRESTEKMFSAAMAPFKKSLIGLTSVSSSWMSTCWLCGFSKQYSKVSLAPNSSSFLRILWMGSLEVTAIELSSVIAALKSPANPLTGIDEVVKQVKAIGSEKIATLGGNLKSFRGEIAMHTLLYVPCGWILVEKGAESSTPLVYGCRTSSFYQTKNGMNKYGLCKDLLTGGKQSGSAAAAAVAKMESIFELIDAAQAT